MGTLIYARVVLTVGKVMLFLMRALGPILEGPGNRPLPSSKNPHFRNEARCTTFLVKMSFICMRMKNDFHIKG